MWGRVTLLTDAPQFPSHCFSKAGAKLVKIKSRTKKTSVFCKKRCEVWGVNLFTNPHFTSFSKMVNFWFCLNAS